MNHPFFHAALFGFSGERKVEKTVWALRGVHHLCIYRDFKALLVNRGRRYIFLEE
jgi:hypothetical protein